MRTLIVKSYLRYIAIEHQLGILTIYLNMPLLYLIKSVMLFLLNIYIHGSKNHIHKWGVALSTS